MPEAHPKQFELINSFDSIPGLRFVVGACGTKFGKTYGCTIRLVKEAWENKDSSGQPLGGPGRYWWVAPTFSQSKMAYELVIRLLPKDTYEEHKADMKLVLKKPDGSDHSIIEFKSGDNESSLRGFAVNFFIMDEAARMKYESFVSLMTTVTQTRGRGIIISTPKGRGWFYEVYQRGEKFLEDGTPKFLEGIEDKFPEWFSIRMPTWSNPTVPLESIHEAKRNLPEADFRQEYAAHFLLDSAGVFHGIRDCIKGGLTRQPLDGHHYVMGVDLARLKDFTVLTVIDKATHHVVDFARFNNIRWEIQYHRIIEMARKYRAQVVIDSTGIGDPIVETLKGAGLRLEPYKIGGSASKQQLIDGLRVNIEHQNISFPPIPQLVTELENYEYHISDGGSVKYSAPSNQHDDCVISLALANWGMDQQEYIYKVASIRGV